MFFHVDFFGKGEDECVFNFGSADAAWERVCGMENELPLGLEYDDYIVRHQGLGLVDEW